MANVSHAGLTATNLHEPKGIATASSGQVYVANGAASGAWTLVEGLTITGMIADFSTPVAPSGWLELDGSSISTTTYAALYAAMTIQQAGTRTGGSAIITGLSSTTHLRVGYSVFGTGITAGTTILTIDGPTQITMSAVSGSSGTNTVAFSPWALGSGTITLPNVTAAGRYRRSRTSSVHMGTLQSSQNLSHSHAVDTQGSHSHTGTTSLESSLHVHNVSTSTLTNIPGGGLGVALAPGAGTTFPTGNNIQGHNHTYTTSTDGAHTHTLGFDGGSETRPSTLVVITCVKI